MKKMTIVSIIMAAASVLSLQAQQSQYQQGQSSESSKGAPGSQGAQSSQGQGESKSVKQDTAFIHRAAQANLTEVQLGKLGSEKAQNQQIKQFAQNLQSDHQKANQQLQELAQKKGIQVPQSLDPKHEKEISKLQSLSGADFDKQFALENIKAHAKTISLFQKEAQQGQDPDLRQYAQSQLPGLTHHLSMAQDAARNAGVSQTQITSILKRYPQAMGGTGTPIGREQGGSSSEPAKPSPGPSSQPGSEGGSMRY